MPHQSCTLSAGLAGLAAVALLAAASAYAEDAVSAEQSALSGQSSLSPESSAEWQGLLAPQVNKLAVSFTSTKIPNEPLSSYQRLFAWNEVALDTTAIDHTPVPPGETYIFGQQFGPPRTARALAITHIAMFEAVNAVYQRYQSYAGVPGVKGAVSVDAAIAQSAHDALVFLYPSQQSRLDALLAYDLSFIKPDPASVALGKRAAAAIVALRSNDGSETQEPVVGVNFTPHGGAGWWAPDPISKSTTALGANWAQVKPFVIKTADQFRPVPPPSLSSDLYTLAYYQVEALGGDPNNGTPSFRTPEETQQGIFWTYDGTPNICAPGRLYNQVARTIIFQRGLPDVEEVARFFAVFNTALADSGLAAWEAKWHYQFWRPITGIRFTGNQGNPALKPNTTWYPLGAQATNTTGPNFTPPFPAYPSGHATFGGTIFEVLRAYFQDNQPFTFVSDEFNGQNFNTLGQLMPLEPVTFQSLTQAEYLNAESRIWVGVHWQFDADNGVSAGRAVADYVLRNAFQPVTRTH